MYYEPGQKKSKKNNVLSSRLMGRTAAGEECGQQNESTENIFPRDHSPHQRQSHIALWTGLSATAEMERI